MREIWREKNVNKIQFEHIIFLRKFDIDTGKYILRVDTVNSIDLAALDSGPMVIITTWTAVSELDVPLNR